MDGRECGHGAGRDRSSDEGIQRRSAAYLPYRPVDGRLRHLGNRAEGTDRLRRAGPDLRRRHATQRRTRAVCHRSGQRTGSLCGTGREAEQLPTWIFHGARTRPCRRPTTARPLPRSRRRAARCSTPNSRMRATTPGTRPTTTRPCGPGCSRSTNIEAGAHGRHHPQLFHPALAQRPNRLRMWMGRRFRRWRWSCMRKSPTTHVPPANTRC